MLTAEGSYHQRDSFNLFIYLTTEHSQKASDACITAVSLISFSMCIASLSVLFHRSARNFYVHLIGNHGLLADYAERSHLTLKTLN